MMGQATPQAPGSQASLHEANRRRIVHAVRAAGAASQAQLARTTGLSAATVSNIVHELDASARHGMAEAQRLIDELIGGAEIPRPRLIGVGMGLPGPVGEGSGAVGPSTILPGWTSAAPRAEMERRLGLPVHVDNDANLDLLAGATWGAAQDCAEAAYVKVARGVGAGILIGGAYLTFLVTGGVLLLAAGVDALARKRRATGR